MKIYEHLRFSCQNVLQTHPLRSMFSRFSQVVPVVPAVGTEAPISLDLWRGCSAKLKRSSTLSRDVANDCNTLW